MFNKFSFKLKKVKKNKELFDYLILGEDINGKVIILFNFRKMVIIFRCMELRIKRTTSL
jgi:hypothetical protein